MNTFLKKCPILADTIFSQNRKKIFWIKKIVRQMMGLIIILFFSVVMMTINYILKSIKPNQEIWIKASTWVSLGFTLSTYIYFLLYMFKLNNNVKFEQKIYDSSNLNSPKNKSKNILKNILSKDEEKLLGVYFYQAELLWTFIYFIIYLFWIFWAATFIANSASSLNLDTNIINILNFLINSVGLGVISSGVSKIYNEYTKDRKYYSEWLKRSNVVYKDLFVDLKIVNEVKLQNSKLDLKFGNKFLCFYNNETKCSDWNVFVLNKYCELWSEYWNFINSKEGNEFIDKPQNVKILRITNSFFAHFLNMSA